MKWLRWFFSVRIMRLEPGDVVKITLRDQDNCPDWLNSFFGNGVRVLVLRKGQDVAIVRLNKDQDIRIERGDYGSIR